MAVKRVLVIEGEVEDRRMLAEGLSSHGYDVKACKDGLSAIHELEQSHSTSTHFDYVVTDAQLTDIAGIKILRVLKTAWPKLPMLVVAAEEDGSLAGELEQFANTGSVSRPLVLEDVVEALGQLEGGETTKEHRHLSQETEKTPTAKTYVFGRLGEGASADNVLAEVKAIHGVNEIEQVEGEVQLVLVCWRRSLEDLETTLSQIREVHGFEVIKANYVVPAHLDTDVSHFIEDYNYALEKTVERDDQPQPPFAYLIVDIDPAELQAIFTKMFFLDNSTECEVTGGGNRVIARICEADTPQYALDLRILGDMPGVLRILEARVV
jgi:CheY-like chemotaxis protein